MFNNNMIKQFKCLKDVSPTDFNLQTEALLNHTETIMISQNETVQIPIGIQKCIIDIKRKSHSNELSTFEFISQDDMNIVIELDKYFINEIYNIEAYGGNYINTYKLHFIKNGISYLYDINSNQWIKLTEISYEPYAGTKPEDLKLITYEKWSDFFSDTQNITIRGFIWGGKNKHNLGRFKVLCKGKKEIYFTETNNFIITSKENSVSLTSLVEGIHEYKITIQRSIKEGDIE